MNPLDSTPVVDLDDEVIDYDSTFVDVQPGDIVIGRVVRVSHWSTSAASPKD